MRMSSFPGRGVPIDAIRNLRRGLLGRGWFARLLLGLATIGLLTPALTALDNDLAGWSGAHGHIYPDGVHSSHPHPWDRLLTEEPGAPDSGDTGVAFTWDASSVILAILIPAVFALRIVSSRVIPGAMLAIREPAAVFLGLTTPPPRVPVF